MDPEAQRSETTGGHGSGGRSIYKTLSVNTSPLDVLRRALMSTSITSSFPRLTSIARDNDVHSGMRTLRVIGRGTCGTVFELPGSTTCAFKKGTDQKSLWRDFHLTNRVATAMQNLDVLLTERFGGGGGGGALSVPRTPVCDQFRRMDDAEWWAENEREFPEDEGGRGAVFRVERILPLAAPIRDALIDTYFHEDDRDEAKDDEENDDCLVRLYLGKRRASDDDGREYRPDTLRNFELCLDELEALDLNPTQFAEEMAIGLAVVHWEARVNGMDMEFVLGSAASKDPTPLYIDDFESVEPFATELSPFKKRPIHLWMLDFDKSRRLDLTSKDSDIVDALVVAVTANDPYFPKPGAKCKEDQMLFEAFAAAYLKASNVILKRQRKSLGVHKDVLKLPQEFLEAWAKREKEIREWDPEEKIKFG